MTVASVLIAEIRDVLQDTDATAYRWSDVSLLRYMSSAQKQIVSLRSEANTVQVTHTVADAIARRSIPTDGVSLVKVVANLDHLGVISSTITRVQSNVLDAFNPDWRYTVQASPDVDRYYSSYTFDKREPQYFFLYPRAASGYNVVISYVKTPAVLSTTSDTLELSASYDAPVIEYMLWRALSVEGAKSDSRGNPATHAKQHFDNFAVLLQLSEKETSSIVNASHPSDFESP
jgi:hypothetical protein